MSRFRSALPEASDPRNNDNSRYEVNNNFYGEDGDDDDTYETRGLTAPEDDSLDGWAASSSASPHFAIGRGKSDQDGGDNLTCWQKFRQMKCSVFIGTFAVGVLLFLAISFSGNSSVNGVPRGCDPEAKSHLDKLARRLLAKAQTASSSSSPSLLPFVDSFEFCVYNKSDSDISIWLLQEAGWTWRNVEGAVFNKTIQPIQDAFAVEAEHGKVFITATTTNAAARGFYWYLKNVLACQVTWGADQLGTISIGGGGGGGGGSSSSGAAALPDWPRTAVLSTVAWRHAWNMCTFGYTSTWWDWARWERELDWMALHGVNFPLAFVGQEYVWVHTFAQYGIEPGELESWFTGPAFLPWQRAGNVEGWGGPLPMQWIIDQRDLQRKILRRMKELGMTPILPCFAGHVPAAARRAWPHAKFKTVPTWNHFPHQYADVLLVDPTDPAFRDISEAFMKALKNVYGLTGYYACDTFNEVDPPSDSPEYLSGAARAVVDGISTVDDKGVWIVQAWIFSVASGHWWQTPGRVRSYLSGAPKDRTIVLDLHAEDGSLATKFDNFYDHASIWCLLHNFGGVRGMYGNLSLIAQRPHEDLKRNGSTVIGMGFTPEAIEQNPIVYELMTENFFGAPNTHGVITKNVYPAAPYYFSLEKWVQRYLIQRYALGMRPTWTQRARVLLHNFHIEHAMPKTWRAWKILLNGFYNQPREPRTELEDVPVIRGYDLGAYDLLNPPYYTQHAKNMFEAMRLLLEAINDGEIFPENSEGLHYDLVDIARQTGTTVFRDIHALWINSGQDVTSDSKMKLFNQTSDFLQKLLLKIDDVLGTDKNYLLGTWIGDAERAAASSRNATAVRNVFRFNAKNQITMWGPTGQISDYAAKGWSGLYSQYYHGRWVEAAKYVRHISGNINYDELEYNTFMLGFEVDWNHDTQDEYPATASGKSIKDTASAIFDHISLTSQDVLKYFTRFPNATGPYDSFGTSFDLQPMWTKEVRELAKMCHVYGAACQGFTETGYLLSTAPQASALTPKSSSSPESAGSVVDVFVRK